MHVSHTQPAGIQALKAPAASQNTSACPWATSTLPGQPWWVPGVGLWMVLPQAPPPQTGMKSRHIAPLLQDGSTIQCQPHCMALGHSCRRLSRASKEAKQHPWFLVTREPPSLVVTCKNMHPHCQMSPGEQNSPTESHWFKGKTVPGPLHPTRKQF